MSQIMWYEHTVKCVFCFFLQLEKGVQIEKIFQRMWRFRRKLTPRAYSGLTGWYISATVFSGSTESKYPQAEFPVVFCFPWRDLIQIFMSEIQMWLYLGWTHSYQHFYSTCALMNHLLQWLLTCNCGCLPASLSSPFSRKASHLCRNSLKYCTWSVCHLLHYCKQSRCNGNCKTVLHIPIQN